MLEDLDGRLLATLSVSCLLTAVCWVLLWRGRDRVVAKVGWSVVAAVPVMGPILYAGLHHAPSVQDEVDRAHNSNTPDGTQL